MFQNNWSIFLFQILVKVRLKQKLVKLLTKDLKSIILDTSKSNDGYFYQYLKLRGGKNGRIRNHRNLQEIKTENKTCKGK